MGLTTPHFYMTSINSIAFALDPQNIPGFLLDWELTKRCNLDCSYCGTIEKWGLHAGHDNSTSHPALSECLKSIDFMYEYVDQYMQHKKPTQRKVVLNVYGGESIFHPDIVEILQACRDRYSKYQDQWHLTITCTTNAIAGASLWEQIIPLIDEFTLSYHSEILPKQKVMFKTNALRLQELGKRFKVVVVMHNQKEYWNEGIQITEFLKQNSIRYTAKPLDNEQPEWAYTADQFSKFKTIWLNKVPSAQQSDYKKSIDNVGITDTVQSIDEGRPCCGGRKLSLNGDLKSNVTFVPKQGFRGWSCSVNWFFLFVRQYDGMVYTNKDCEVSTTGIQEPLGNLSDSNSIITTLRNQLETKTMPVITCVKDICRCGFCAPKAESRSDFMKLIERNVPNSVFSEN